MPGGVEDGIVKGLYKFKPGAEGKKIKAHIFGSGSIMQSALKAQEILAEKYGVTADVWSATSYKLLRTDAIRCQRWNMLHPTEPPKKSYVENCSRKSRVCLSRCRTISAPCRTRLRPGFPAACSRSARTALAAATRGAVAPVL